MVENGPSSLVTASPSNKSNKSTLRNSIDKKSSIHSDNGGRTSSSSSQSHGHQQHILTQNESPVVVMTSTQPNPPQNYAQSSITSSSQQQSNNLIIVKKDMAIDPDANQIPVEHYGLISLKIAAAVKKAQQQNISNIKKSPSTSCGEHGQRREFYQIDDNLRYETISSPPAFKLYTSATTSSEQQLHQQQQQQMIDDVLRYTEKKKRIAQNHEKSSSPLLSSTSSGGIRESSKSNKFIMPENGQPFTNAPTTSMTIQHKNQHFPEALSFLTIKEEPLEWSELDANGIQATASASILGDGRTDVITVKPETLEDIENSLSSEVNSDKVYSPLTCEVCNLKFHVPSAWVRHIESHSEHNQTQQPSIPKKRKRVEEVRGLKFPSYMRRN